MFMAAIMISVQPLLPTTKASEGYSFLTSRVPYRGRERGGGETRGERDHYYYSVTTYKFLQVINHVMFLRF